MPTDWRRTSRPALNRQASHRRTFLALSEKLLDFQARPRTGPQQAVGRHQQRFIVLVAVLAGKCVYSCEKRRYVAVHATPYAVSRRARCPGGPAAILHPP